MRYVLEVAPRAKERPRTTFAGGVARTYTPRPTREREEEIRYLLMAAGARPLEGPLRLALELYLHAPLRPATPRAYPTLRSNDPDVDQLAKLVMDAGNGILWRDDVQIVELVARKLWTAGEGRIELEVGPFTASA